MNACLAIYTLLSYRLFLNEKLLYERRTCFPVPACRRSQPLSRRGGGMVGWMYDVNTGLVVGVRSIRSVRRLCPHPPAPAGTALAYTPGDRTSPAPQATTHASKGKGFVAFACQCAAGQGQIVQAPISRQQQRNILVE